MAFVRKQQLEPAREEAKELKAIAESKEGQALEMPNFPGSSLIEIARNVLDGELAGLEGRWDDCVRLLADAVQTQDDQPYMEPPYWFYPVRQSLGAALLRAGRISEAESVYREDLERNPHNGWSLFGLLQSLRAQGKTSEADKVQQEFQDAWAHADVTLTASCF